MSDQKDIQDNSSFSLAQAKLLQEEAKSRYDDEYARAFTEAPTVAMKAWGLPRNKITENALKQFAINDPKVKEAKANLLEAKSIVLAMDTTEAAASSSVSPSAKAEASLRDIELADYEQTAWEVFSLIREQVEIVGAALADKSQEVHENSGKWTKAFWDDTQEEITSHKSDLTGYSEQLRSIIRSIPSQHKDAVAEIRGVMEYAGELRDDCKTYLLLCRTQQFA